MKAKIIKNIAGAEEYNKYIGRTMELTKMGIIYFMENVPMIDGEERFFLDGRRIGIYPRKSDRNPKISFNLFIEEA